MAEQTFLPRSGDVAFPEAAVANLVAHCSHATRHGPWWVRGAVHWLARGRRTRGQRRKRRNCGERPGCRRMGQEGERHGEDDTGRRRDAVSEDGRGLSDEGSDGSDEGGEDGGGRVLHCLNEFAIFPRTCGWGSFGKVKAALDMSHQLRPLAFKTYLVEALRRSRTAIFGPDGPEFLTEWEKVRRELLLQACLKHRNICPLYGVLHDVSRGELHLVMQFLPYALMIWDEEAQAFTVSRSGAKGRGNRVGSIERSSPLLSTTGAPSIQVNLYTEQAAKRIIKQILDAVDYLHSLRVVHKDIKPQNILAVRPPPSDWLVAFSLPCNTSHSAEGDAAPKSSAWSDLDAARSEEARSEDRALAGELDEEEESDDDFCFQDRRRADLPYTAVFDLAVKAARCGLSPYAAWASLQQTSHRAAPSSRISALPSVRSCLDCPRPRGASSPSEKSEVAGNHQMPYFRFPTPSSGEALWGSAESTSGEQNTSDDLASFPLSEVQRQPSPVPCYKRAKSRSSSSEPLAFLANRISQRIHLEKRRALLIRVVRCGEETVFSDAVDDPASGSPMEDALQWEDMFEADYKEALAFGEESDSTVAVSSSGESQAGYVSISEAAGPQDAGLPSRSQPAGSSLPASPPVCTRATSGEADAPFDGPAESDSCPAALRRNSSPERMLTQSTIDANRTADCTSCEGMVVRPGSSFESHRKRSSCGQEEKYPAYSEVDLTKEMDQCVWKLTDFNSATVTADGDRMTIWDSEGTRLFTPPECLGVSDANGWPGKSRDLWSVGVCLYCLLFGRPPFTGNTGLSLSINVITQALVFPDYRQLSADAADLLRGLLCKDPEKRLTSQQVRQHRWMAETV
ncbi:atypical mek-related kinase (incomplete catalytic triad) [Cystoisospora suis]|uniref:Atypical mek-related kinase (Incomplete catalytic triad) n=1 Tax=Cystoisospora suis TaxID=483139 RepID=A0A2C6L468_9APIC|nr:atypical mek-related kinase (incomplete catalytic triad) [Cystoisospora suis]